MGRVGNRNLVIGIDASRNRSGGAIAHLAGVLANTDPTECGIAAVHVWSYRKLLDALPDLPWLSKHNPPPLQQSLARQAWWQWWSLPGEVRRQRCDVLLSPDAGTVGRYRPSIVMSRDMLSYEPGAMQRYGFSKARLRLILLKYIQARSLKRAAGAVFLTQYAARVIQDFTGPLANVAVIPHGVGESFRQDTEGGAWPLDQPGTAPRLIRCLYVSNAAMYKHQWEVVRAVGDLRGRGHNLSLCLAGGGSGPAQALLDAEIARTDPDGGFVSQAGFVRHADLPALLAGADIFIFASSCENMPNTLVEAMASGLPIACSDRGPMPEVLRDGGVYFDPRDWRSIAVALERLLLDRELRIRVARRAKTLSADYSWARCARETWAFVRANAHTGTA